VKVAVEHITAPCRGQTRNGDGVAARTTDAGTLLAVVDGLGHGPMAAEVADRAVACLSDAPLDLGVAGIMELLHESLRGTRGAAAMLAVLKDWALVGCGVGNVELRAIGSSVPVVQSPGILGVRVRRYNLFSSRLKPLTRLALFSDGISARVPIADTQRMAAREACEFIFQGYRRPHDDATILVADLKE